MIQKLLSTDSSNINSFIARLFLGLILLPHGAQKLLGLFGGYGFTGTMGFFTGTLHLPYIVGLLVIIIEFFGALSMVLGFATRFWSISIICIFIGMIATTHIDNGFFMNWFGNQKGEGFEYHLLVLGLALITLISGGGKFSVDTLFNKKNV
jgi:putative oxidoreductase